MKRFGALFCVVFLLGILADRLIVSMQPHIPADAINGYPNKTQDAAYTAPGAAGKETHATPAERAEPAVLTTPGAPATPGANPTPRAPATPGANPILPTPVAPATATSSEPTPTAAPAPAGEQGAAVKFPLSHLSMTATADLGQVTFTYHITPTSGNADAGIQMFAHHDEIKSEQKWEPINPVDASGKLIILGLYQNIDNTGTFTVALPKGTYGATRVILFNAPDGKNVDMSRLLYDTNSDPHAPKINLHLTVVSAEKRITAPLLDVSSAVTTTAQGNGSYTATFVGAVKVPQGYHPQENGFWVMAKGPAGFAQKWVDMNHAVPGGNSNDSYQKIPFELTVKDVKTGLWNMQFGLFKYGFGDPLYWTWPGTDFAAGDWVRSAPAESLPPRLRLRNNRFETLDGRPYDFYAGRPAGHQAVSFLRGGNYGNAIGWTITPLYNRPGYFVLLKGMGCHFMRVVFNPERYFAEAIYRDAVDQVVQNMWIAGLYPVIGPQGLMKADTLAEQIDRSIKLIKVMALRYKGKPVWMEMCNEPFEVPAWSQWKPVAIKMTRAIREIDPDAFVIAPLEGWGKDGRAAAKDPITEVHVDLYDAHAYIQPEDVARNFADDIKAGIPLYIGEYGGNNAAYLSRMDLAFQNLHGLMAAAPWAFTKYGQDGLPLIADGSTAVLHYTPAGQQIAEDYALWDQGKQKTR